ncbi:hypothetical protein B0H12DRAFT_1072135 [Mycena haematopus]|nr:hypothetical protein B0H12DRAFT_1072135 [Mycena haematopus]
MAQPRKNKKMRSLLPFVPRRPAAASVSSLAHIQDCKRNLPFNLTLHAMDGETSEHRWAMIEHTRPASAAGSPLASAASVPDVWASEAEAQWQQMALDISGVAAQWAAEKLGDADKTPALESSLSEAEADQERHDEHEKELHQAWDFLLSQALDAMPQSHRREWLRERRLEDEWALRSTADNDACPSWVDWSTTTPEYLD